MLLKKRMKSGLLDQNVNESGLLDFWSRSQGRYGRYFQNIVDISPIFPIFYRYISDIYRYFSRNSNTCARDIYSRYFAEISKFPIFRRNISNFTNFWLIFLSIDFWLAKSCWYRQISDISTIYQSIYPIFCSLV